MHTVLWSPVGAPAGVPGPRRNADDCDAGWFAPVATRRRFTFQPKPKPGPVSGAGFPARARSAYSVRLNSTIATNIMISPMAATMPSDRPIGTGQPAQVIDGEISDCASGVRLRWLMTASRIGPTT